MSDEEEFLSEESYEFEFEEDDEEGNASPQTSNGFTSPENMYYNAKGLKEDSPIEAIEQFKSLVESSEIQDCAEWVFRSHKQLAKMYFDLGKPNEVLKQVSMLMKLLPKLNGNYAEESINKLLNRFASSSDPKFVNLMYEVIVSSLQDFMESGPFGSRLWLKININRLNILLEDEDLSQCPALIQSINQKLETVSDLTQSSYALDMIAAEITYIMRTNGSITKLNDLYRRSVLVFPAIIHPQVMGVVRECGATVQFFRGNYEKARVEFYESFKSYDEAGSVNKTKVLKYLSLCCLLVDSEVNPFESQETQSYAQLPEFKNLIAMISAYEEGDLVSLLSALEHIKAEDDPLASDRIFLASSEMILHNLKSRLLLNYSRAFKSVRFDFLREKLHLTDDEQLEKFLLLVANSGKSSHFTVSFSNRVLQSNDGNSHDMFPPTLDDHSINGNLQSLYRLNFCGYWPTGVANSSGEPRHDGFITDLSESERSSAEEEEANEHRKDSSSIYELLFCDSLKQLPEKEIVKSEWLRYVRSSIPASVSVDESRNSLHDESELAQNEHGEAVQNFETPENQIATANTNKGILGSSLALESDKETHQVATKDKLSLLQSWAHKLETAVGETH